VELLKEIAPGTTRVALLFNPKTAAPAKYFMPSVQAAASSLGVQADVAPISNSEEIESIIKAEAAKSGAALIITPDPFNVANRDLIIALAARYRVPAIYFNRADIIQSLPNGRHGPPPNI
jgi:putative tryptophan/tyrosine transport system substrate-binding protein